MGHGIKKVGNHCTSVDKNTLTAFLQRRTSISVKNMNVGSVPRKFHCIKKIMASVFTKTKI